MSQPIPEKLIRDLSRAPLLEAWRIRRYAGLRAELTPTLRRALWLVCEGFTTREIAARTYYSEEAAKDHIRRLVVMFGARNRAHLAALAVAQGYVDMAETG